jgi:divalent metal cation (Fe/Co/Zn/Cd) transporter
MRTVSRRGYAKSAKFARWIGHRLHAEINLAVASELSVAEAHKISQNARHGIFHQLQLRSHAVIHIDPHECFGETFLRIEAHEQDETAPQEHP